ncbi:hypothetical protein LCGC14_2580780 [marine sediment metagenome]|uniref:Uncharacterized protein n=1 Tax=marine sediment metagenome TaxID=412755 RepID=A0A0F9AEF4_9ZZZZ
MSEYHWVCHGAYCVNNDINCPYRVHDWNFSSMGSLRESMEQDLGKPSYEQKQYCYWGLRDEHYSKSFIVIVYIFGILMGLFGAWVL